MKWIFIFLFCFSVLNGEELKLAVGAQSAILINAKTGAILFEKEAHQRTNPASTTKIATALYTLKTSRARLEELITAEREALASITPQAKIQSNYRSPPYWLETDGTHVGIKRGEQLRLYDLLNAILIASANDASNVVAMTIGGTVPKFMDQLNVFLREIGCQNTSFSNPHGLTHPAHLTTAYDLALMAKEGLKDPIFRRIVASTKYLCPATNLEEERTFIQTNRLLKQGSLYYPKAIGVKTGTTQAAGKNLVAAAQDKDRELIAVVLGYRGQLAELYKDVIKMFETAFNEPKMRRTLLAKGPQQLTTAVVGAKGKLKTALATPLYYDYYPSEESQVSVSVAWEMPPLPILEGACVAKLYLKDQNGNLIQETPLYAFETLRASLRHQLSTTFSRLWLKKGVRRLVFVLGAGCIALFVWKARKRRQSKFF